MVRKVRAVTNTILSQARGNLERYAAGFTIAIDTDDFDQFSDFAVGWRLHHQAVAGRQVRSRVFGVQSPAIQLGLVEHLQGYSSQGAPPAGGLTFVANLDLSRPIFLRGRPITAGDIGCSCPRQEFEMLGRRGSRHLVASISERLLEQRAMELFGRPFPVWQISDRYRLAAPDAGTRYVGGSLQLLEQMSREPSLLDNRSVTSAIETTLAENLLLAVSPEARLHSAPHRHQIARRAYGYMLDRLGDVASVSELCGATGGNYATLERGFRELYGLTPRAYLHAARLLRARRDLQHPQPTTTVTGVAIRWGFFELGRFSVQYRLRFGESPSDTMRRVRGC